MFIYISIHYFHTFINNLQIRVEIQSISGSWAYVCTEVTDSSGRIRFSLPEQIHLPDGLYPIKMTAESDPDHPVIITLAIVPPQTEVVVFSVDGSFAASLSLMGKVSLLWKNGIVNCSVFDKCMITFYCSRNIS